MRSSALAMTMAITLFAGEPITVYRQALPGYRFQFPRDHFDHPEFRTEWWYYTGNLRSSDGKRFGYELTFFRHALQPKLPDNANVWDVRDVWMAHFALSDIDGQRFFNKERLNRSGAGLAGIDARRGHIWNGNWRVEWTGERQKIRGIAENFSIDLSARALKRPVTHGANGVSQKSAGAGRASHYVSLTRLATEGAITVDGKQYRVEGLSWMDHEFFSHSMESNQAGWDWFSLQFEDGSDLMLYRLRRKDGSVEPYSSGTYVDASGASRALRLADFSLEPGRTWTSPATKARYPIEWTIRVPSLSLVCRLTTHLPQQELGSKSTGANTYWEGAIEVEGTLGKTQTRGSGYLEMTGYAGALQMGE
jgi:predicted secreted hydrolase